MRKPVDRRVNPQASSERMMYPSSRHRQTRPTTSERRHAIAVRRSLDIDPRVEYLCLSGFENGRNNMPTGVHIIAASVGFVSFFLCWLATVWGPVLPNAWASPRLRHNTVYGIHHTVALLGLCLGVVHALAQLAAPSG